MKNIIVTLATVMVIFFSGCNEKEVIEISNLENQNSLAIENDFSTEISKENAEPLTTLEEKSKIVIVYVCGEVKKPGVYELNENSRVIDAISLAGGYTDKACVSYLNLAGAVSDEQKIYVPSKDEVNTEQFAQSVDGANEGGSSDTTIININKATKEELMTLPGIGASKAEKIISYREENGMFQSPESIMQISGIKDGLYNKIKDRICAK